MPPKEKIDYYESVEPDEIDKAVEPDEILAEHYHASPPQLGGLALQDQLTQKTTYKLPTAAYKQLLVPFEADDQQWPGTASSTFQPTPDAHINLTDEQSADPQTVVKAFETQHYVRQAPDFAEQATDTSRTNTFRYRTSSGLEEVTEYQGLNELQSFLRSYAEGSDNDPRITAEHRDIARNLLDKLTLIGGKEFQEGVNGIAALWRSYLDEHPGNVICVPTGASKSLGKRKSDIYLLEHVLDNFSDEELERYSGRIKTDPKELTEDPERVRIILLDDWIVSGTQIDRSYSDIFYHKANRRYQDRVEANFIAASAARIEQGIPVKSLIDGKFQDRQVPVKAYYQAKAAGDQNRYGVSITGTHSSTDYSYQDGILNLLKATTDQPLRNLDAYKLPWPPLTNVQRPYSDHPPRVSIGPDGTIRRQPQFNKQ